MDHALLRKHLVQAADDNADNDMNLQIIKDNAGYKLAQNVFRIAVPDEQNMSQFPNFIIKLDRLLAQFAPKGDDTEEEEEDTDNGQQTNDNSDDDDTEGNDSEDDDDDADDDSGDDDSSQDDSDDE